MATVGAILTCGWSWLYTDIQGFGSGTRCCWLCDALDVSRSGFHAWLNRSPSARSRHDEVLVMAIDRSFKSSDRTYGARRVSHDVLAEGLSCGLHRIERLMRHNGLRARPRRRGLPKDTGERAVVSHNLLDRAFEASAPNQKWIAGFTYIWTAEGWLYVAAAVDLCSRRVVGWVMKAEIPILVSRSRPQCELSKITNVKMILRNNALTGNSA